MERLNSLLIKRDLIDSWIEQHPGERDFTWARNNPFVARRLDFILVHSDFIPFISKTKHDCIAGSDHKRVCCFITTDEFKRGKSYWKFNAELLQDFSYLNYVNDEIDNFMQLEIEDPIDRFQSFKNIYQIKNYFI